MRVGIFHFDLDGVTSSIMLKQGISLDKDYQGGYHRFEKFVDNIEKGDQVVIADCSFTVDLFAKVKEKAKSIIYIDHHPDSAKIKETFTEDLVIFDDTKAGAGLCFNFINKRQKLSKELKVLAMAANHYDLWHHKEDPEWFWLGYDLNAIFWEIKYWGFEKRFRHGFDGFRKDEKTFLKSYKAKRDNDISNSSYTVIGNTVPGLVCIPKANNIMNDIALFVKGYSVYYIIMKYPNLTSISVRSNDPNIDLSKSVKVAEFHNDVLSAGGHKSACGITLKNKNPTMEAIVEIIEKVHERIELDDSAVDDIPF